MAKPAKKHGAHDHARQQPKRAPHTQEAAQIRAHGERHMWTTTPNNAQPTADTQPPPTIGGATTQPAPTPAMLIPPQQSDEAQPQGITPRPPTSPPLAAAPPTAQAPSPASVAPQDALTRPNPRQAAAQIAPAAPAPLAPKLPIQRVAPPMAPPSVTNGLVSASPHRQAPPTTPLVPPAVAPLAPATPTATAAHTQTPTEEVGSRLQAIPRMSVQLGTHANGPVRRTALVAAPTGAASANGELPGVASATLATPTANQPRTLWGARNPRVLAAICYAVPFVASAATLLGLLGAPRNRFVRLHAAQSLILFSLLGVGQVALFIALVTLGNLAPTVGWLAVALGLAYYALVVGLGVVGLILWLRLISDCMAGRWRRYPALAPLAVRLERWTLPLVRQGRRVRPA